MAVIYYNYEVVLRLLLATVLGGILGIEREIHGKPAGLRTHLLVTVASCGFMVLSIIVSKSGDAITDPGRIGAQIVTGIGFLGAGAIIKEGCHVRGLTTAACLWVCAAIGMTAGAGVYLGAAVITMISVFALVILPFLENVMRSHTYRIVEVIAPLSTTSIPNIIKAVESIDKDKTVFNSLYLKILGYRTDYDFERNSLKLKISLRLFQTSGKEEIEHLLAIKNAIVEIQSEAQHISWYSH